MVASPKAFIVVAAVWNTSIVEVPDIIDVDSEGEIANTAEPDPVSSDKEVLSCNEVMLPEAVPYNVPEVGRVTFVVLVVVRVVGDVPDVNELLKVTVPAKNATVLFASPRSRVSVLSAVIAVTFAIFISNAAAVDLIPNEVIPVCVPPFIVGDVKVLLVST